MCDEHVCLLVYMSVREHISETVRPIFTTFQCTLPMAVSGSSVLSWRRCDMSFRFYRRRRIAHNLSSKNKFRQGPLSPPPLSHIYVACANFAFFLTYLLPCSSTSSLTTTAVQWPSYLLLRRRRHFCGLAANRGVI